MSRMRQTMQQQRLMTTHTLSRETLTRHPCARVGTSARRCRVGSPRGESPDRSALRQTRGVPNTRGQGERAARALPCGVLALVHSLAPTTQLESTPHDGLLRQTPCERGQAAQDAEAQGGGACGWGRGGRSRAAAQPGVLPCSSAGPHVWRRPGPVTLGRPVWATCAVPADRAAAGHSVLGGRPCVDSRPHLPRFPPPVEGVSAARRGRGRQRRHGGRPGGGRQRGGPPGRVQPDAAVRAPRPGARTPGSRTRHLFRLSSHFSHTPVASLPSLQPPRGPRQCGEVGSPAAGRGRGRGGEAGGALGARVAPNLTDTRTPCRAHR